MVEHIALSPDLRSIYFSANSGDDRHDIHRRHIFRVSMDRGNPIALTSGAGGEWSPAPLGDGVAYLASTPLQPPAVTVVQKGKATILNPRKDDFPAGANFSAPRSVSFTASDGLIIHGQLFEAKASKARGPGIVYVHGGPARQMLLGWSYMDYYTQNYALNQYLAASGYTVLSVNYRLGTGYGRAFQHAGNTGLAGGSEYLDVLAGAKFLQALPTVDPDRIGIWGGSYGGLLTSLALARDSSIFKAGVDLHGVHDWSLAPLLSQPKRYEQGDFSAAQRGAYENTALASISTWRSPILLIHGDADANVPFSQTVDLARRLRSKGVPFEELVLPDEIHGFLRFESWMRASSATVRFFDEKLKP